MADIEAKRIAQEMKKLETTLEKETKVDQQRVAKAEKHLGQSQKEQSKAEKAVNKADHGVEKAIKTEHKTAQKVNAAAHKHDVALSNQHKAEHDLELRKRGVQEAQTHVQQHESTLNEAKAMHDQREQVRAARLAEARSAFAHGDAPQGPAAGMRAGGAAGMTEGHE